MVLVEPSPIESENPFCTTKTAAADRDSEKKFLKFRWIKPDCSCKCYSYVMFRRFVLFASRLHCDGGFFFVTVNGFAGCWALHKNGNQEENSAGKAIYPSLDDDGNFFSLHADGELSAAINFANLRLIAGFNGTAGEEAEKIVSGCFHSCLLILCELSESTGH